MALQDGKAPLNGSSPRSRRAADPAAIRELSRARLPTRYGEFVIVAFEDGHGNELDDVALVRGLPALGDRPVPVRLHSECLTADVLGSLRCDCGDQLRAALERLGAYEHGVLLYMRQEGRGIGIANKVSAYALQDQGLDTFEANRHLGFDDDLREYGTAAALLHLLGVRRIALHTNNPNKVQALQAAGIDVVERVPLVAVPRAENRFYLATKRLRSGHLLGSIDGEDE